jgi:hypothetical protein
VTEETRLPATPAEARFALVGMGHLAVKMLPFLQRCRAGGIQIVGVDVTGEPKFLRDGHGQLLADYFNISRLAEFQRFLQAGLARPFELAYVASLPASHCLNILDLRNVCQRIIVTKPLTTFSSKKDFAAYLRHPDIHPWASRLWLHDHFITKPAVAAVGGLLSQLHAAHGRYQRIVILLTERRTVNEELDRLEALRCGQLLDMASHAVAILQELVPRKLLWQDRHGNTIARADRQITPTACVEGQNMDAPYDQTVSTADLVEFRVEERLTINGKNKEKAEFRNTFYVLLLCGKGFAANPAHADRDLKAVEVTYRNGVTGMIDIETNAIGGTFDGFLSGGVPEAQRNHRGINLPLLAALEGWEGFLGGERAVANFHPALLALENMELLYGAWQRGGRGRHVLGYGAPDRPVPIQDFVNTHAVRQNGFQESWHLAQPPLHLMFGNFATSPVA